MVLRRWTYQLANNILQHWVQILPRQSHFGIGQMKNKTVQSVVLSSSTLTFSKTNTGLNSTQTIVMNFVVMVQPESASLIGNQVSRSSITTHLLEIRKTLLIPNVRKQSLQRLCSYQELRLLSQVQTGVT